MALLIDGTNLINMALFRAHANLKGKEESEYLDLLPKATRHVFTLMIEKLARDNPFDLLYVAWDAPGATKWRRSQFTEYKIKNGERTPHLKMALDIGHEVIQELGHFNVDVELAEADDVIYALASILNERKTIVSRDKDFIQVVQKGLADRIWDSTNKKYMDIPPYNIIDYKCLVGDSSDHIPGVQGVGPKRAIKMIQEGKIPDTEEVRKFRSIIDLALHPKAEEFKQAVATVILNRKKELGIND